MEKFFSGGDFSANFLCFRFLGSSNFLDAVGKSGWE